MKKNNNKKKKKLINKVHLGPPSYVYNWEDPVEEGDGELE